MGAIPLTVKQQAISTGNYNDCFDLPLAITHSPKPMQQSTPSALIESCKTNDRKAQRILYESFYSSSMRVCKRYCNNYDNAMEVLNAGFLKVFTQLDKYTGKGSFEGWVHHIMVNTALDQLRKEKKFHTQFVNMEEFPEMEDEESRDDEDYREISLEEMYRMIQDLPPASRMVFNLYVFDNYSHDEISKALTISPGTSKWHLSSARKTLQEKIRSAVEKVQGTKP